MIDLEYTYALHYIPVYIGTTSSHCIGFYSTENVQGCSSWKRLNNIDMGLLITFMFQKTTAEWNHLVEKEMLSFGFAKRVLDFCHT